MIAWVVGSLTFPTVSAGILELFSWDAVRLRVWETRCEDDE